MQKLSLYQNCSVSAYFDAMPVHVKSNASHPTVSFRSGLDDDDSDNDGLADGDEDVDGDELENEDPELAVSVCSRTIGYGHTFPTASLHRGPRVGARWLTASSQTGGAG